LQTADSSASASANKQTWQDAALVAACLQRNVQAEEVLYKRHGHYTLGICRRHTPDTMEAQDWHQNGWIRSFEKLHTWDQTGPFRAWLRRVFVHVCLGALQKKKKQWQWLAPIPHAAMAEVADPSPVQDFVAQEHLMACIAALPTGARLVFNLFAIEGHSHAEVAEILGISETNSRQQLVRARATLAQQLQGQKPQKNQSATIQLLP
jgi:RNA polymerase sigma factor (sigma-70 family)